MKTQNFKRENHLKYHEEICINEIQVPTMVDILINSDETVPEVGSVDDKTLSENNDPNKINDTIHGLLFPMKLLMLMKMLF